MSAEHLPFQAPFRVRTLIAAAYLVMAPLAGLAIGARPIDAQASQPPTAIERALIERTCNAVNAPSVDIDANLRCFGAQLLSLRADFGHDLSRLSTSDRRKIDAACNRLHTVQQRDAYLNCVDDQLAAVRARQHHGARTVSESAAASASPPAEPSFDPAPNAPPVSWSPSPTQLGGAAGSVFAGVGAVVLAVRSRRVRRACRVCGVDVPDADLCPTCRREAAESLRRAAQERQQFQKAQEAGERRRREQETEQRAQKARDEETARLREQELAMDRQELETQRLSREAAIPALAAVGEAVEETRDEVFDPYVVLGVPNGAGQDAIRVAYQEGKTKYDPEQVSSLGYETQAHFKTKAESVERAYRMLSELHLVHS